MTDRLNKLAAAVDAYGIMAQDNDLLEAAALLRAASAETVGTEWPCHWVLADYKFEHDQLRNIARVAIASVKAERERDEWKLASSKNGDAMSGYQSRSIVAEQQLEGAKRERDAALASLAERQRAIDEAFATLDAGHGMLACRDASHILRPHATKATEGQIRTAAHYTRAEAKANVDAIINKVTEAKQPRQWTSTPPKDRSRKWWNAYGVSAAHAHYRHIIPDECSWDNATHLVAESDYDLWLPWQEGDTADNLPPLPTEATPATTQPTAGVTPVGSGTTPQVSPVGNDDTRELVARLAECVRNINPVDATLGAIIAAARRGGGA